MDASYRDICTCMYIFTNVNVAQYVCAYTYMCVHIIYMCTYNMHLYTYVCMYECMYMYVLLYVYMYMYKAYLRVFGQLGYTMLLRELVWASSVPLDQGRRVRHLLREGGDLCV
jgi:hypothetical protein